MTIAIDSFVRGGAIGLAVCLALAAAAYAQPATSAATSSAPAEANKYFEFVKQRIGFGRCCFYGDKFPAGDFESPAAVKDLIGPYTISTTYFDATGRKVTAADKPGRYAAVVEVKRADGRTSRRFVTLCRLGGEAFAAAESATQPAALKAAGIDAQIAADRAEELALSLGRRRGPSQSDALQASLLAGLFDLTALKADAKPLPKDTLANIDRQWWVTFKRSFYGYDKLYPKPFICPRPLEGKPAAVVHEGTLKEAGMKEGAVEAIDAACAAWEKDIKVGFNLCVVRHGVIAFNKAYGQQTGGPAKDSPFTTDTAAQTASATKFLGGILMMEFVDQGLIDLDEQTAKYVPPMRGIEVKHPLTVREMYTHVGGFSDGAGGDFSPDLEEIVVDMYAGMEVAVKHRYGGTGLALGGKIMENISGESTPALFTRHLIEPMGVKITSLGGTSGGAIATALDLARIGQMMLNGGEYGDKRYLRPETIQKMQPVAGQDRWFPPDKTLRWGVGIKAFDSDGLSDQSYGHPGAGGTSVVVDPAYDLVISMTRFGEGPDYKAFLKRRGQVYRAILDGIAGAAPTSASIPAGK